jgi:hypothetical protein
MAETQSREVAARAINISPRYFENIVHFKKG